jgi:Zn-dependent peptidase ImmA (M78 family)
MTLRRGFKKEAEELALELRNELDLAPYAPIDIFALAKWLAIPAVPLSAMAEHVPDVHLEHFRQVESDAFSGVTIHHRARRLILYNDSHADVRLNSTVAHELAHALLGHCPSPLADDDGKRNRNAEIEAEANWLSGAILVPQPAAIKIVFNKLSIEDAAIHYAVSESMIRYRLRVSGAQTIFRRCKAR